MKTTGITGNSTHPPGIRVVAFFERMKRLFLGFGLLGFIHKDLRAVAAEIVRTFHLNTARHYPSIFIDAFNQLTSSQLWIMALSALFYQESDLQRQSAYGWSGKGAEWFGLLTGGMYIPVELLEIMHQATPARIAALLRI